MNEQWFWEKCGLQLRVASDGELRWFDKDKEIVSPVDGDTGLPCIDLNNLFKYAVPVLFEKLSKDGEGYKFARIWDAIVRALLDKANVEDAVFRVIYEAFGGK